MIDWVDEAMKEWAREMKGAAVQLGFPTETIEYRMMKYGPDSLVKDSKGKKVDDTYVPEDVAKTEEIMLAMCKYDRTLLIIAYTMMVSRVQQAKIFSEEVGYTVSRRQFMIDLDNAQSWYCGYLKVERKFNYKKVVDTCAQKSV